MSAKSDKDKRIIRQMNKLNKFAFGSTSNKRKRKSKAQSPRQVKDWLKSHPA